MKDFDRDEHQKARKELHDAIVESWFIKSICNIGIKLINAIDRMIQGFRLTRLIIKCTKSMRKLDKTLVDLKCVIDIVNEDIQKWTEIAEQHEQL